MKTINDIVTYCGTPGMKPTSKQIEKDDLKEEAIKWIKEDIKIGEERGIINDDVHYGALPNPYGIMIIRWMQRFNITEEELK